MPRAKTAKMRKTLNALAIERTRAMNGCFTKSNIFLGAKINANSLSIRFAHRVLIKSREPNPSYNLL